MPTNPPRGSARGSWTDPWREPSKPIKTEADAQRHGWNVHSLDAARERRWELAWGPAPESAA